MLELRPAAPPDIPELRALWQEAFGDTDAFLDDFFTAGFAPERSRVLAAEGKPASALYWFDGVWGGGRFAYLYAVATKAACRGLGFSTRLLEDACKHLQGLGYDGALLVPGEKRLFRFYARRGFAPCCPMETAALEQGAGPFAPLTPEAYAALREKYRDPGDGILTGAALQFFARVGCFWACSGGCMAALTEQDGQSFVMESFGSVQGEKSGTIRRPGGTDYAMFRPLSPQCAQPPQRFFMALD